MTQGERILLTIPKEIMDDIDREIRGINEIKDFRDSKTNRQALINGLICFALQQDIRYSSRRYKEVLVRFKEV